MELFKHAHFFIIDRLCRRRGEEELQYHQRKLKYCTFIRLSAKEAAQKVAFSDHSDGILWDHRLTYSI